MHRRNGKTFQYETAARSVLGSRIPLTSLIQAIVVAEYLNFRHAANALGVAQSSGSARTKALEETLGVLLFERRHRGVRLIESGCRFVVEVSAGIDIWTTPSRRRARFSSGAVGQLGIGLIGRWWLSRRPAHSVPRGLSRVREIAAHPSLRCRPRHADAHDQSGEAVTLASEASRICAALVSRSVRSRTRRNRLASEPSGRRTIEARR
jgi:DNA-binding transcriptional LysR family regulator